MLEKLGERLSQIRSVKKKTQREIAQEIGITAAALSAYEKGTKTPSLEVAVKLAHEYGVSLDWLCMPTEQGSSKSVKSVADLFACIVKACDKTPGNSVKVLFQSVPFDEEEGLSWDEQCMYEDMRGPDQQGPKPEIEHAIIDFRFEPLVSLVRSWERVRSAYLAKAIDEELYDLWLHKAFTENSEKMIDDYNNCD